MRFDTLVAWLDWQSGLHPNEIELGLERVAEVQYRMGGLSFSCPVITVAGTNGKGSTIAFLDAILRGAGYRVGCYTSPHLVHYNERVRIDGQAVSDERLMQAFERVDQARHDTELTYFEFGTLAALEIFADSSLDVVILEVGLGGRLDAVNLVDADVAVITTVDLDHTDWLGDTREQIAREKAGIMRHQRPLVYGEDDMPQAIAEIAQALEAPVYQAGDAFSQQRLEHAWNWSGPCRKRNALPFPYLRGDYQLRNAATALMALELLDQRLPLDQRAVRIGLQDAKLAGRFQIMGRDPLTILDVGHNVQAMTSLASNLSDLYCPGRTLAVFSMLADKQAEQSIRQVSSRIDDWYIASLDTPRTMSIEQLKVALEAAGVDAEKIHPYDDIQQAFQAARADAAAEDRVLVFGSFYAVGGVMELAGSEIL